jgi:aryl-alcohol dehydrogenase-like predicted oxidoreductase
LTSDSNFPGFGIRPFGRTQFEVSPVAISGSTLGLKEPPIEVYRAAIERGINFFFWDAFFKNMTRALQELPGDTRSKLFIIATINIGGPKRIRRELEKKLDLLKLEKISCYNLGWVRSRFRVRQSVPGRA